MNTEKLSVSDINNQLKEIILWDDVYPKKDDLEALLTKS